MKPRLAKLALSLAVFVLFAAAIEGGLRLFGFENPPPPPILIWSQWQDKVLDGERGIHVADPDCLWIPRANNPIRHPPIGIKGSRETVNAAGFRGPELAREPTPGVLRIATLGDSSTFGYGVRWEDTYSAQLVRELARRDVTAEVLCAGVVGFTAVQGLERYRHHVRPYAPDVVVAAFGTINEGFDIDYSDLQKLAMKAQSNDRSGRWRRLRERWRVLQLAARLGRRHDNAAPMRPKVRRVAADEYEAALRELAELVAADGARLILISMPRKPLAEERKPHLAEYTARLTEIAERDDLQVVDAYAEFRAEGDLESLMLDAYHPTPAGHARLAAMLARAVAD